MTPDETLEFEKQIQKAWDAVARRRARGESDARMLAKYQNMVRVWRLHVQQQEHTDAAE